MVHLASTRSTRSRLPIDPGLIHGSSLRKFADIADGHALGEVFSVPEHAHIIVPYPHGKPWIVLQFGELGVGLEIEFQISHDLQSTSQSQVAHFGNMLHMVFWFAMQAMTPAKDTLVELDARRRTSFSASAGLNTPATS